MGRGRDQIKKQVHIDLRCPLARTGEGGGGYEDCLLTFPAQCRIWGPDRA